MGWQGMRTFCRSIFIPVMKSNTNRNSKKKTQTKSILFYRQLGHSDNLHPRCYLLSLFLKIHFIIVYKNKEALVMAALQIRSTWNEMIKKNYCSSRPKALKVPLPFSWAAASVVEQVDHHENKTGLVPL